VFGHASNFKRVPTMRNGGKVASLESVRRGCCSFDEFIPTKPVWGQGGRGYRFDEANVPEAPRSSIVGAEAFDQLLECSQRLERGLQVQRLKEFRREISVTGSEDPNAQTDEYFYSLLIHLYPQRRRSGAVCRCGSNRCSCLGLSLGGKEIKGLWKPQVFESVYNQGHVVPLAVSRKHLDVLIEGLEEKPPHVPWCADDVNLVRSVLAYRRAVVAAPLPVQRRDQFWKILVKHCVECATCGRNAEELEEMIRKYERPGDRSCPQRVGTARCWGCKELICYVSVLIGYLLSGGLD
jgi:hypothetical protein